MHESNYFVLMLIARVSLLEFVDPDVVESFHDAARKGDVSVVADMLREGVLVDLCDMNDRTALFWATHNNRNDVVNVLLVSGANVNWQNRDGWTPFMIAAISNNTDVMEVLLHHGADRSIVDVSGRTALDWVRLYNHKEAFSLLENY